MRSLILGIGNLLLCDEGVGVHAVRALQQEILPSNVEALDVGTAFLDAIPKIEGADRIIIIDAMKAGHAPGTVYRVPLSDCFKREYIASMHGFDMSRVLFLAGRTSLTDVIVIGVEPARIEWSTELSEELHNALQGVIDAVKNELAKYGSRNTKKILNKESYLQSDEGSATRPDNKESGKSL